MKKLHWLERPLKLWQERISAGCAVKKFTLIELLIVIAIIGILASLLLPSLRNARNKAYDAVCLSNQKQIGILIAAYTNSNDEMLPNHRIGNRSYIEFIEDEPTPDLYRCPRNPVWTYSDGSTVTAKTDTVNERLHLSSYGYNGWWLGLAEYKAGVNGQPMGRNYMFVSDSKSPSDLIVTSDTKPIKSGSNYMWGCSIWYIFRRHSTFDKVEGAYGAHGSKDKFSSILYLDGHVGKEIADDINLNSDFSTKWNPDIDRWPTQYD